MKWLLHFLLLATVAMAAVSEPDKQGFAPSRNIIYNGGFENGKAGWIASGGTFTTTTTGANVGYGNMAGGWLGSASGQTLSSKLIPIPPGLYGRNGVAACLIQGAGATHTLGVSDGTNVLLAQPIISGSTYNRTVINFIFPSSGSLELQLATVAVSEPQIYIDDCFIQPADTYNFQQVSQASFVGQIMWDTTDNGNGNFTWSTGGTPADASNAYPSPVGLTQGNVTPAPSQQFGFTFTGGPGDYYATFQWGSNYNCSAGGGSFSAQVVDENSNIIGGTYYQIANAGNNIPVQYLPVRYTYTTGGTHSWHLQAASSNCSSFTTFALSPAGADRAILHYFPSQAQLAFTPTTSAWFVDASYFGYSTPNFGPGYYPAGTALTTNPGSIAVSVPCSGINPPDPSGNCTSGTSQSGISFFVPLPGAIKVCAAQSPQLEANGGSNANYDTSIDWTANNDDSVVIKAGQNQNLVQSFTVTVFNTTNRLSTLCENFIVPNSGQVTFRLNTLGSGIAAGSVSNTAWTVTPITQNIPAPILVGSVVSDSAGVEKIERVIFGASGGSQFSPTTCTSDPCTIYTQTGSWLSAVNRISGGVYNLQINPGVFSGAPSCTSAPIAGATITPGSACFAVSTSQISCQCYFSAAGFDCALSVLCMGPH